MYYYFKVEFGLDEVKEWLQSKCCSAFVNQELLADKWEYLIDFVSCIMSSLFMFKGGSH